MGLKFIDVPRYSPRENYEKAIEHLVSRIKTFPGVIGIIRFGHVTTPGISDIDLLVIFENDFHCHQNPFEHFPEEYKSLFTHGVDAMSYDFFKRTPDYTFWFNSKCIWGDENKLQFKVTRTPEEEMELKIQTATEFLITNYMDLSLQVNYGIIKLRAMLQHLKGLQYDFEFMDVKSGKVYEMIIQLREWIKGWYQINPGDKELEKWILEFYPLFHDFIRPLLEKNKVYVPQRNYYAYARNIIIKSSDKTGFKRNGIKIPNLLSFLGKKYYNLQHRFNKWEFYFPMRHHHPVNLIKERFEYFRQMRRYNDSHFPHFDTLTTGFSVNFG